MTKTPVTQDVPTQIETPRLLIRCPAPGDGATVFGGVVASLEALRQFPASLPWAAFEPSIEDSERYCREGQAKYLLRTEMPMLLFLKATNVYVGGSGLHSFDWSVPKCETGYWLHRGYTRQGLATEAVTAITAFAFNTLGMRRVVAFPDDENVASCKVCERAGYKLEGVLRNERVEPSGKLRDTRLYAIVQ
jgi:RimJ/RimL family protein N-acetyltransferase